MEKIASKIDGGEKGIVKSSIWTNALKMSIRHPSRNVKQAAGYMNLKSGNEIWTGYIHLGLISTQTVNKDVRLNEIIQEVQTEFIRDRTKN